MTTKDMDLECYGINLETADKENYQRMVSIPTKLIEKALALTNKTMEYMDEYMGFGIDEFSYPKLYAYLLSPEFIEKYEKHTKQDMHYIDTKKDLCRLFGQAIGEYQANDEKILISLLSKI